MTPKLDAFAEVVAKANDQLMAKHTNINTLMGIIDKALRAQGMAADAITVDAPSLDKKIVFLLPDEVDGMVEVALGDKSGAINSKSQYALKTLDIDETLSIMTKYFITH
tara:strand:- start:200 stop:526 length:327 start_codon:yes stop_codon:yes gene_type:complete